MRGKLSRLSTAAAPPPGWSHPSEGSQGSNPEQQCLKPWQSSRLASKTHWCSWACESIWINLDALMLGAGDALHEGTERGCCIFRRETLCAELSLGKVCAPRGVLSAVLAPLWQGRTREVLLSLRGSLSCSPAGSSNKIIARKVLTGEKQLPRSSHSILNYSRPWEGLR